MNDPSDDKLAREVQETHAQLVALWAELGYDDDELLDAVMNDTALTEMAVQIGIRAFRVLPVLRCKRPFGRPAPKEHARMLALRQRLGRYPLFLAIMDSPRLARYVADMGLMLLDGDEDLRKPLTPSSPASSC